MCRGPLPYGHAGATRIFSDSGGSFAARRRAKDHTNECEEHRERRSRRGRDPEREPDAVVMHDGDNGDVGVMPDDGHVRDRYDGRAAFAARRWVPMTSGAVHASGNGRRPGGTNGEATRRKHGRPHVGGCDHEPGGRSNAGRRRNDERRFGG
jgi:hypothetical protein